MPVAGDTAISLNASPRELLPGGDVLRIGVRGLRAQVDHVRPGGAQGAGPLQGRVRVQEASAVGERVAGDVDDAEDPDHGAVVAHPARGGRRAG